MLQMAHFSHLPQEMLEPPALMYWQEVKGMRDAAVGDSDSHTRRLSTLVCSLLCQCMYCSQHVSKCAALTSHHLVNCVVTLVGDWTMVCSSLSTSRWTIHNACVRPVVGMNEWLTLCWSTHSKMHGLGVYYN